MGDNEAEAAILPTPSNQSPSRWPGSMFQQGSTLPASPTPSNSRGSVSVGVCHGCGRQSRRFHWLRWLGVTPPESAPHRLQFREATIGSPSLQVGEKELEAMIIEAKVVLLTAPSSRSALIAEGHLSFVGSLLAISIEHCPSTRPRTRCQRKRVSI